MNFEDTEVGTELPAARYELSREDLRAYAEASGDHNPIHLDEATATSVGLPDVIAHGMLTMAHGARLLTDWVGDPSRVLEYSVRFTKPVVVPDTDEGVEVAFGGTVAEKLPDSRVRVDLTATCGT